MEAKNSSNDMHLIEIMLENTKKIQEFMLNF